MKKYFIVLCTILFLISLPGNIGMLSAQQSPNMLPKLSMDMAVEGLIDANFNTILTNEADDISIVTGSDAEGLKAEISEQNFINTTTGKDQKSKETTQLFAIKEEQIIELTALDGL